MKRLQLILFTLLALAFPCVSNNIYAMDDSSITTKQQAPPQVQLKPCNVCSKKASLACGNCSVPYCNKDCQKSDRKRHKPHCSLLGYCKELNALDIGQNLDKETLEKMMTLLDLCRKLSDTEQELNIFKEEIRKLNSKTISDGHNRRLSKEEQKTKLLTSRIISTGNVLHDNHDNEQLDNMLAILKNGHNSQLLKEARTCAQCGKKETKSKCPCKGISYCNKECQKADWKKHKQICPLSKSATKSNKN